VGDDGRLNRRRCGRGDGRELSYLIECDSWFCRGLFLFEFANKLVSAPVPVFQKNEKQRRWVFFQFLTRIRGFTVPRPVGCSGKGRKIMSSGAGCVIVVTPVESRHPASCRVSLITRFLRVFSVAAAPPITESFLRNGACRCWWCCVIQLAIHYKKCASHKSDIFYCSRLDEF
jgi:hypothetical protein